MSRSFPLPRRWLVSLALASACGGGETTAPESVPPPGAPVRLEIAPGALLLEGPGAVRQLRAIGRDAQGRAVPVTATFESSRPSVVNVDAAGAARGVARGSARITARANGLVSAPVLAMVATPATGVVVVPDSLAVDPDISPVDPLARPRAGWQYRVRLRGDAPAVGQLLIGDGATPILGRVVAVESAAGIHSVTLELRPLAEVLPDARVEETLPFDPSRATLDPALRSTYRLQRAGTRLEITPTVPGTAEPSVRQGGLRRGGAPQLAFDSVTFRLGPLTCKGRTTVLPRLSLEFPSFSFDPGFSFEIDFDAGQERFEALVVGNLDASVTLKPRLTESFGAELTCKEPDMVRLIIPINGPLSLLVGGYVPIGGGFKLSGSMTVAQFGFDITLGVNPTVRIGLSCASGACLFPNGLEFNPAASARPILPDITSQFRVNLEAYPFATFGLAFGGGRADVWDLVGDLDLIAGQAGFSQTANLAPASVQVADPAYASAYRLAFKGEVGAGESTTEVVEALQELLPLPEFEVPTYEFSIPVSRSPSGALEAAPASVGVDDSVTVTVALDTVTYLDAYAVDRVVVQRSRSLSDGGIELTPLAGPCGEIRPAPGQQALTCRAAFADTGTVELRAFVYPRLFGVALPTPLDLGNDVKASVTVGPGCGVELNETFVDVRSAADLARLANVRRISGSLTIYDYSTRTVEFTCLEEVGGRLRFSNPPATPAPPIQYLFSALRTVGSDLQFSGSSQPLPFAFDVGFPALASVGSVASGVGAFQVFSDSGSVFRIAAPLLATIGNNIQLQGGQLREFRAPALQRVGSNIIVTDMPLFERLLIGPAAVGVSGTLGSSLILARLGSSFTGAALDEIPSGVDVHYASIIDNRGFSDATARAFAQRVGIDTVIVRGNSGP